MGWRWLLWDRGERHRMEGDIVYGMEEAVIWQRGWAQDTGFLVAQRELSWDRGYFFRME